MKITRRQLRQLIRESWDPKLEVRPSWVTSSFPHYKKDVIDYHDYIDSDWKGDDSRAKGMLSYEENEKEKQVISDYHSLYGDEIKKFYSEISKENGIVTCLHSPSYEGVETSGKTISDPVDWVLTYGKSKHQISTCMFPNKISDMYSIPESKLGENSESVFWDWSIILGGYPVLMNYDDMWTQTLSAVPPELVDFQKNSGLTKSTSVMPNITNFRDFISKGEISEETVLANYFVKGIHATITTSYTLEPGSEQLKDFESLIERCHSNNIPLYVTNTEASYTKRV